MQLRVGNHPTAKPTRYQRLAGHKQRIAGYDIGVTIDTRESNRCSKGKTIMWQIQPIWFELVSVVSLVALVSILSGFIEHGWPKRERNSQ